MVATRAEVLVVLPLLLVWIGWEVWRARQSRIAKAGPLVLADHRTGPIIYTWMLSCYVLALVFGALFFATVIRDPAIVGQ